MPKIKGWTPAWLDKPSPGSKLFAPSKDDQKSSAFSSKSQFKPGPTRTIARSGSQVFVAVGKEVRWADLIDLKERWQEKTTRGRSDVRIKRENSGGISDDDISQAAAEGDYAGFRVSPFLNRSNVVRCRFMLLAELFFFNCYAVEKNWFISDIGSDDIYHLIQLVVTLLIYPSRQSTFLSVPISNNLLSLPLQIISLF